MEPAELLEDLCVVFIVLKDTLVCFLCRDKLIGMLAISLDFEASWATHVFLLLVNVADLKPDVFLLQWTRRIVHNVPEALSHIRNPNCTDAPAKLTSKLRVYFCLCL